MEFDNVKINVAFIRSTTVCSVVLLTLGPVGNKGLNPRTERLSIEPFRRIARVTSIWSDRAIRWARLAGLLALGLLGGSIALFIGLPMPFLVGSLVATGAFTVFVSERGGRSIEFPQLLRRGFTAVIGVMIGATFSREFVVALPSIWLMICTMIVFVVIAQAFGYAVFRHVGGYDRVTALFAGMPGGLIEAIALGEENGGDVRVISIQHFARIVLVVLIVPMLFLIFSGETVGSAAGENFALESYGLFDILAIGLLAAAGIVIGPKLRLPASYMMGPLLLSAVCHATGLFVTSGPGWLLGLAQLIVGSGLGTMFSGSSSRQLLRAFGLSALSIIVVLVLSGTTAILLDRYLTFGFGALFISFAPGGVTEMGLIALSLGANPVVVATNHLFRIILTVFVASRISALIQNRTRE